MWCIVYLVRLDMGVAVPLLYRLNNVVIVKEVMCNDAHDFACSVTVASFWQEMRHPNLTNAAYFHMPEDN